MNTFIWVVQALLAIIFAVQGFVLINPPEPMRLVFEALPFSRSFMVFIGVAQMLGAIGLILPLALNIQPQLTPLAATGLTLIMVGAFFTHLTRGEVAQAIPSFVIALLAAFVAYIRTKLAAQPRAVQAVSLK